MWKGMMTIKVLLVFVGMMLWSTGVTALWIAVGILLLIGAGFISFRQGQGSGHEACGVSKSIARVEHAQDKPHEIDPKLAREAWSVSNGVRAIFAGAAIGYIINAVYIIMMLLNVAEEAPMFVARLFSLVATIPYYPIVAYWVPTYTELVPALVAVMMIGPFVLPACQFAGYMCGPKLWEKTEKAMKDGKRRAKARSRIVKKRQPKVQKPEI